MPTDPAALRRRRAVSVLVSAIVLALSIPGSAAGAQQSPPDDPVLAGTWSWPVDAPRIVHAYEAPAHRYAPGHRGIDIQPSGGGVAVVAPSDGTVAFAGMVAGRPVLTLDHGDGLVTTLEPLETLLAPGTKVSQGDEVGIIALGGHTEPGAVHFGVRWHGEYINPLLLLDGIPRAVLLPCC